MIRMDDPNDHATIKALYKSLEATGSNVKVTVTYEEIAKTAKITKILEIIFTVTIAIMMFLCFFSLSASMSANLYE